MFPGSPLDGFVLPGCSLSQHMHCLPGNRYPLPAVDELLNASGCLACPSVNLRSSSWRLDGWPGTRGAPCIPRVGCTMASGPP